MINSLAIGVHDFDSASRVGAWYYAHSLAKQSDRTTYLPAPLSPFHLPFLYQPIIRQRFAGLFGNRRNDSKGVICHHLFSFFPAGPVWPFNTAVAFDAAYSIAFPKLKTEKYDLVYCDNPYLYSVLRHIEFSTLVVRIPDILPGPEQKGATALLSSVRWMVERAGLVIAVSEPVRQQIKALFNQDALVIGNGVDVARFAAPQRPPADYTSGNKNIVYVGAFDYWLDTPQIALLSERLLNAHIYLIGPASAAFQRRLSANNIHFTGSLTPEDVVPYLQHADVGIIPFDIRNHRAFVEGINPLKAYEYLAAGIPVVSSDFAGVRGISPWVSTASDADRFCDEVENYLHKPPTREEVKASALTYDWATLLQPFEDFVHTALNR